MDKNINARVGILSHLLSKKTYLTTILSLLTRISQSWRYRKLVKAIRRRELTTNLEILAESGIEGDLALFVLANIPQMGVAR